MGVLWFDQPGIGRMKRMSVKTFNARWDYADQLSPETHTLKLIFSTTSTSKKAR